MSHWLFLSFAILAEVAGTLFLKQSDGFTRLWPSIVVIASYAVAFYFLSVSLKTLPVGVAYAVWAGVGVALITVAGYVFLGQVLDLAALVGIALILAGVVIINLFSGTA